jgi:PPK2 family polyphosphate:nucleotide phosphotransferase
VDEAGTTDVLCADKTGTLTHNALTVTSVRAMPGFDEPHVLALVALASSDGGQDPVDGAIRAAAGRKSISDAPKLVKFEPFDPAKKMSEATATDSTGSAQRIVKGAFAAVIGLAEPSPAGAALAKELEGQGFRVLAVAVGPAKALKLAGVIALSDPPRADSAKLVTELHGLGVRVVMVTGDAPATAAIVARAVGLDGAICPPGPIPDNVRPEQFAVFAGVLPEDKYKLVKAFQKGGHTVGMCGDGANDAPALRQAQIGIAVSTATDVAKSAAGMVLTEAGLAGIVAAVKEGRITFQRIQTYTLNAIIKKIVTVLFLIVGLIMTGQAILTPLLMVIIMVTGDFLSMSLTTDNVRPSPMPNSWRIGNLTTAGVVMGACLLAFCTTVLAVGKFRMNLGIDSVRTLAFVALVFGSQATIYAIRERRHLWGTRPSLLLAVSSIADIAIASTLAVGGIAMTALPALLVAGTLVAAAIFAFVLDFIKVPVFARLGVSQRQHDRPVTQEAPSMAKTEGAPIMEPSAGQPSASESKPEAKAEARPEAKDEPERKPEAEPKLEARAGVAALLNSSLGDLLVAGLVKDPEDAGRMIAAAISQAATPDQAAKAPEHGPEPMAETEVKPKPGIKAKVPPDPLRRPPSERWTTRTAATAGRTHMKIDCKNFRVREGDNVHLQKWPTRVDPVYKSKDQYKSLLEEHVAKLSAMQQLHYASNRHAVLLILQATDAAGKDGAIRHVMSGVNPQGCRVYSFKQPTAAELEHDFLWRTSRDLPGRGRIAIFNRSYYEEVLVVRVHRDILHREAIPDAPHHDAKVWRERYRSINDFEKHLNVNGTRVVKFFLHLSKEEQRKRFLERIDDAEKNWKFSDAD